MLSYDCLKCWTNTERKKYAKAKNGRIKLLSKFAVRYSKKSKLIK